MENYIKIGIGVMIKSDGKILLGKRCSKVDPGGIFAPGSWTLPGGKQEYDETIYEGAIREIKEETNLDLKPEDLVIFGAADDIQPNKHFITMHIIANSYSGVLKNMEPTKHSEWKWFDLNDLPENLYSPSKKFIDEYIRRTK